MKVLSMDVGVVNMAICILDTNEKIYHWDVFSIGTMASKVKKTRRTPDQQMCRNLFNYLDSVPMINEIDIIVIENQPFKNPTMRVVEGWLVSYFTIRNIDHNLKRKIVKYSPKYKLKCYKGPIEAPVTNGKNTRGKKYNRRKKLGVLHTEKLVQGSDYEDVLRDSKKADDLSDSFLQGVSYIRFKLLNKKVPDNLEGEVESDTEIIELSE